VLGYVHLNIKKETILVAAMNDGSIAGKLGALEHLKRSNDLPEAGTYLPPKGCTEDTMPAGPGLDSFALGELVMNENE